MTKIKKCFFSIA